MKNLNIKINVFAAVSALGGSIFADAISAHYKVIGNIKNTPEIPTRCITYGEFPATIGPGVFINPFTSLIVNQ